MAHRVNRSSVCVTSCIALYRQYCKKNMFLTEGLNENYFVDTIYLCICKNLNYIICISQRKIWFE